MSRPWRAYLLDRRHMLLLRAALGEGATAMNAYRAWHENEPLDEADDTIYRILPLLLATAEKCGLEDRDTPRMRGAIKHIWLSNMLRSKLVSDALATLERAGIEALIFKGAALFARNEEFAALRAAGDYDLLVRRADAPRAIAALIGDSFETGGMAADRFAEPDFDAIHAAHFRKKSSSGSLDLHWRPLPMLRDPQLIDDLFAHAEPAQFAGRTVSIPCLADHLFLAIVRPEPWEIKETFLRAIEATHLLADCAGTLDWERFAHLVSRHAMGWIAAPMLGLIRDEFNVPMPGGIVERIWRDAAPGKGFELFIRRRPPYGRGGLERWVLRLLEVARTTPERPGAWRQWRRLALSHPAALRRIISASLVDFHFFKRGALRRLWTEQAAGQSPDTGDAPAFVRGFSIPEIEGRWTDGQFAVFEVPVEAPAGAIIPVTLGLAPFLPGDAKSFKLQITGGVGAPRSHALRRADSFPAELLLNARVVGAGRRKVVIALHLKDAGYPQQLGLSDDLRQLGLNVKRIDVGSSSRPAQGAGQKNGLDRLWREVASSQSYFICAQPSFTRGFGAPEATGRWTIEEIAILQLPVAAPADAVVRVRLRVSPFYLPGATTFAYELATGHGLAKPAHFKREGASPVDLIVDARAVGTVARKAVIAFRLIGGGRPHRFGLSKERRRLGLLVQHVEIMQDGVGS